MYHTYKAPGPDTRRLLEGDPGFLLGGGKRGERRDSSPSPEECEGGCDGTA